MISGPNEPGSFARFLTTFVEQVFRVDTQSWTMTVRLAIALSAITLTGTTTTVWWAYH